MKEHPSKLFITSLVFRGKTLTEVQNTLGEYGLPLIPDEFLQSYIDKINDALEGNRISSFDVLEKDYKSFIKDKKIYYLMHPDNIVMSCLNLLDNRSVKHDLYLSLMGRLDEEDIVEFVNRVYKLDITPRTIQVFKHYYFDIDLMTASDWSHVLPEIKGVDP